jgi:hypothetical protein
MEMVSNISNVTKILIIDLQGSNIFSWCKSKDSYSVHVFKFQRFNQLPGLPHLIQNL